MLDSAAVHSWALRLYHLQVFVNAERDIEGDVGFRVRFGLLYNILYKKCYTV